MEKRCVNTVEILGIDPKSVEVRTYGDWTYEAGAGIKARGSEGGMVVFFRSRFGEVYWVRYYAFCRRYASGLINPLLTLEELTEEIGRLYAASMPCDWGKKMLMDIADLLPSKFRE